jgi:hypothetical protein
VALDGDQRAALELIPVPIQNQEHIFANVCGAHVVQSEWNDAKATGRGFGKAIS